jgi:hypothetical protein
MKLLLPIILLSGMCCAQATLTPTLSESFTYPSPSSSFILTITYSNTATPPVIAGLQWTVTMPLGFIMGTPVAGPSSVAAAKTVTCNPATAICIVFGVNANTISPGVVATIPITLSASAPLGPQQISLTNPVASDVTGTSIPITSPTPAPITVNASTGTTSWFSVSIGQATCRASKVAQTPIRLSWVCFNLYGANSGSYTADLNNGGSGTDYFDIGINSISLPGVTPTTPDAYLRCTINVNATQQIVTMLNGAVVPPNSASYNCTGYSQSGAAVLSWP